MSIYIYIIMVHKNLFICIARNNCYISTEQLLLFVNYVWHKSYLSQAPLILCRWVKVKIEILRDFPNILGTI